MDVLVSIERAQWLFEVGSVVRTEPVSELKSPGPLNVSAMQGGEGGGQVLEKAGLGPPSRGTRMRAGEETEQSLGKGKEAGLRESEWAASNTGSVCRRAGGGGGGVEEAVCVSRGAAGRGEALEVRERAVHTGRTRRERWLSRQ